MQPTRIINIKSMMTNQTAAVTTAAFTSDWRSSSSGVVGTLLVSMLGASDTINMEIAPTESGPWVIYLKTSGPGARALPFNGPYPYIRLIKVGTTGAATVVGVF